MSIQLRKLFKPFKKVLHNLQQVQHFPNWILRSSVFITSLQHSKIHIFFIYKLDILLFGFALHFHSCPCWRVALVSNNRTYFGAITPYLSLPTIIYGVMQSDGNSLCGDVILNSFNKASRDEDNILDQVYESKYVRICIMMILIFFKIIRKSNANVALNPNFMSSLLLRAVFLVICIFLNNS